MAKKKPTSATTQDLQRVIQRLNPNVPAGVGDSSLPRVPRPSRAMQLLRTHVSADPFAKGLLAGHIGVGKSTELLHLSHDMESSRFVVLCSFAQTLGTHNATVITLLIAILESCLKSWQQHLGQMPPGLVESLVDNVHSLLPKDKRPPKQPDQLLANIAAPYLQWAELLGHLPKRITTVEQLINIYSEILQRLALRYVSPAQMEALDATSIAKSCEVLLNEIAHKAKKPVLLLIDDLDKAHDVSIQKDIFLERAMVWMRLPCGLVSTVPFELLFSQHGHDLDHIWGEVQILDPLPVPDIDDALMSTSTLGDPSLQIYLLMLKSVDANVVFSGLQCRKLAQISAGLPRSFVYGCSACVPYALDEGDVHVRDFHVDLVHQDFVERWRGRLSDEDYKALSRVLESGGSNIPAAWKLLRDGILIRDGAASEEKRFRVATWAKPLLESYQKRSARPKELN